MGMINYSDECKCDAVRHIRVRRYPVREVSRRLGVSSSSLQKWLMQFAEPAPKFGGTDHESENPRLKRKLAHVTEERDISKKRMSLGSSLVQEPWRTPTSRAGPNEWRHRSLRGSALLGAGTGKARP
jgi:transposase